MPSLGHGLGPTDRCGCPKRVAFSSFHPPCVSIKRVRFDPSDWTRKMTIQASSHVNDQCDRSATSETRQGESPNGPACSVNSCIGSKTMLLGIKPARQTLGSGHGSPDSLNRVI